MAYQKLTPILATGATAPRYLGDRASDIVNLKDFGAAGDGETDDSTAWAAWQTALQSGGMPFIPAGNYLLGEEIVHAPKGHFGRNANSFSYEDTGVVLDAFSAPVYVDGSGDDGNDGFSPATPVQTISRAIQVGGSYNPYYMHIIVAGGSYTESSGVSINHLNCILELQGDVTITSSNIPLSIQGGSNVYIAGNYKLSLVSSTYCLYIQSSIFNCDCGIETASSGGPLSSVAIRGSLVKFGSYVNINGSNYVNGFEVSFSTVDFLDVVRVNVNETNTSTQEGTCLIASASFVCFEEDVFMYSNGYQTVTLHISNLSGAIMQKNASMKNTKTNGVPIRCEGESSYIIFGSLWVGGTASPSIGIHGMGVSRIAIEGGMTGSGAYSNSFIYSDGNSYISVKGTITNAATGARYKAYRGGQIYTGGQGANYLPGNSNGTADASSYGYYH